MKNFWQKLAGKHKPFFVLAPMEDVTDIAFREMFVKYSKGKCKHETFVLFTEFTPSDGLAFGDAKAQEKLRAKLSYSEGQRPVVAQIYNSNPERMQSAAKLVEELGFDGVDINMGCPVNAVVKQVSGSALIKHPELAVEIIEATKRGAPNIPVSVKTRIGYSSKDEMHDWLAKILATKVDALTVHLRTRSQFSRVPADWSLMPEIIKLRDEISPNTIIIGNGDVQSVEQGKELAEEYGCDGIMVGRAAFGRPDFFVCSGDFQNRHNHPQATSTLLRSGGLSSDLGSLTEQAQETSSKPKSCGWPSDDVSVLEIQYKKIKMLTEHLQLFDELLLKPKHKGYHVMKKHFKAYINGWRGAKELRAKLMQTNTPSEAMRILNDVV